MIGLPFTLDYCAQGPSVDPLHVEQGGILITIVFPPSMSEGTVGRSFFPTGWAWWTGLTLRLDMRASVAPAELDNPDALRRRLLATGNLVLRKFLNAYRIRFNRPDVHPVAIDPKALELKLVEDDGTESALPEPVEDFFYNTTPDDAPLASSINAVTVEELGQFMFGEQSVADHLRLDVLWLRGIGEDERAAALEKLIP